MLDIKVSIARVRYNTLSDGSTLCWRLILDGKEFLVNNIDIQAPCFTSKDWIEELSVFKHHITVSNCRIIIDDQSVAKVLPLSL
jgi:hypothetical protein